MSKALVLLNMGGPSNLTEVEVFLRNMFNDENILPIKNPLIRSMAASLIVLKRKNAAKSNYEHIGGKSPINELTRSLVKKLQKHLLEKEKNIYVTYAMRYTPPYAHNVIIKLQELGIKEVILLPLYPQYSTTTTKSSVEDFKNECLKQNLSFDITLVENFYHNSLYNSAVIEEIEAQVKNDSKQYNLIFSAHGLPQSVIDKGDVYEEQIHKHIELLKDKLLLKGMEFKHIELAYQSKVGPMKWLEPSLESVLEKYKDQNVLIYPISFIIDNSETDFELSIEYKEVAEKLGVKSYKVCRCVNDSERFIEAVESML
jgi:ferrochelatase